VKSYEIFKKGSIGPGGKEKTEGERKKEKLKRERHPTLEKGQRRHKGAANPG